MALQYFFIRSTVCLIATKPQSLKQRDVALVSWNNENHLFHRYKHLFQWSPRCSAKAFVQYGFQRTTLKLLSWCDMVKDRLSSLTSRDTNSSMKSISKNTGRSSVRTCLSTAHTCCTLPKSFPYKNSNMYHTNYIPLFYSVARPGRHKTRMLEQGRDEQAGS